MSKVLSARTRLCAAVQASTDAFRNESPSPDVHDLTFTFFQLGLIAATRHPEWAGRVFWAMAGANVLNDMAEEVDEIVAASPIVPIVVPR